MRGGADPQQYLFTFAAPSVQSTGDGNFIVRPGKPLVEMTPLQASRALGTCRTTIYAMLHHGVLVNVRRPSPRKILIAAEEIERLRAESSGEGGGQKWQALRAEKRTPLWGGASRKKQVHGRN